jgi:UDPglucose 6-dehydrogenase
MEITVTGMGVVGTATADCFRRFGHNICCLDIKSERLEELRNDGFNVSHEPVDADVHFICTPETEVDEVLGRLRDVGGLPVIRSSILPGTTRHLMEKYDIHICFCPEFLREATALQDELNPWRVVIGECCSTHGQILEELYRPLGAPTVRVDPTTAEMVKLTCNAYLAMLISYFNEVHQICNQIGVNSHLVGKIASMDPRISTYGAIQHSKPYGGRCLPKDTRTLIEFCQAQGVEPVLLKAVEKVNEGMK